MNHNLKIACCLAAALLLVGTAFAMTWSSPNMLTDDSYIVRGLEDENFGTEETLWVTSEDDEPMKESWLSFMTPIMIDALKIKSLEEISSATLRVYAKEVENPGVVELHFYNSGFFEDTIAWDNDKPEYDDAVDASIDVDEEGWYEFDATSIVKKAFLDCKDCPFSAVLVAKGDASVGFASKEDSGGNVPVLKVTTITA